ncbi:class II aldolase/adducin family protein [Aestuariirhabdus sp. Z084]|uniref:class II aldolase/adducin family protein n=1 Tax=Aestuariirhabdus haliotis TaxID=2918751 RepID=UPI00201B3D77|nr:class II aldolase/adducin family protein [Aestuariirhabdus haliotis]MCL6414217.1 class II aldolase/adducin family protein [Aestuariirhabdus haliotis]MCL6418149.1 class II aldolase/adducin family protein [Aestuariirhabdus haliotis]
MTQQSTNRVKQQVTTSEWETRVNLAACYNLVAEYGWDDLIFTHISAKVPGPDQHFLINPYGMMFDEITASSLVKIDLSANKVMPSEYDINPAGFTIHSAIHEARSDAHCVLHLHTKEGVAVSAQKQGLLPISQQSLFPLSGLSYHDYEGLALRDDEKARLVKDLGSTNFMILRNHGLLTCANTIADAFLSMYILQRACEVQLLAQAGGTELTRVPEPIISGMKAAVDQVTNSVGGGLAWPGLLRKLDRLGAPYRQ